MMPNMMKTPAKNTVKKNVSSPEKPSNPGISDSPFVQLKALMDDKLTAQSGKDSFETVQTPAPVLKSCKDRKVTPYPGKTEVTYSSDEEEPAKKRFKICVEDIDL